MISTGLQSDPAVEFLPQPADPPLGALWRAAHISAVLNRECRNVFSPDYHGVEREDI